MIEVVTFGEGYRVDGANWGFRAQAKLERNWRTLQPGIHKLDHFIGDSVLETNLVVMSDGRGRITKTVDPRVQAGLAVQGRYDLISRGLLAGMGTPVDETNQFNVVLNARISEVFGTTETQLAVDAMRLMYLVRYNPDIYTPHA